MLMQSDILKNFQAKLCILINYSFFYAILVKILNIVLQFKQKIHKLIGQLVKKG